MAGIDCSTTSCRSRAFPAARPRRWASSIACSANCAARAPRSPAGWSEWLLQLIDALFLADPRDEAENHALDALRRLAADLGNQAAETGLVATLPWSVVREALRGALGAVPERQPFLLGGVTFCGLVPQRSIPF